MNLSEKKYLLFDLDGTVIASQKGIFNALDYTLKRLKMPDVDFETKSRFIGPSIGASFIREFGASQEEARAAVEIYREYYGTKGLFECSFYDGLCDVLKILKAQGKHLVIATKKPEMFAKQIMERLDTEHYFEGVFGSEPGDTTEYKGYVLKKAMAQLQVQDKAEVLMIGDTKYDCFGAKEAEVDCLGVGYGYGSLAEMIQNGAVATAKDMDELKRQLTGE